jgi:hypothetical protein
MILTVGPGDIFEATGHSEGQLIKQYAMKTYGGSGCNAARISDLGTNWRSALRSGPANGPNRARHETDTCRLLKERPSARCDVPWAGEGVPGENFTPRFVHAWRGSPPSWCKCLPRFGSEYARLRLSCQWCSLYLQTRAPTATKDLIQDEPSWGIPESQIIVADRTLIILFFF